MHKLEILSWQAEPAENAWQFSITFSPIKREKVRSEAPTERAFLIAENYIQTPVQWASLSLLVKRSRDPQDYRATAGIDQTLQRFPNTAENC